ncbi:MAG: hypothetical protein PVF65_00205 [Sphingomonadales bacterium]|jgi:hypothetical protein
MSEDRIDLALITDHLSGRVGLSDLAEPLAQVQHDVAVLLSLQSKAYRSVHAQLHCHVEHLALLYRALIQIH